MQYYTSHNEHMVEDVMGPGGEFNIVVQLTHGKGGGKNLRLIVQGECSLLGMTQSLHQWTQSGYGYLH